MEDIVMYVLACASYTYVLVMNVVYTRRIDKLSDIVDEHEHLIRSMALMLKLNDNNSEKGECYDKD